MGLVNLCFEFGNVNKRCTHPSSLDHTVVRQLGNMDAVK